MPIYSHTKDTLCSVQNPILRQHYLPVQVNLKITAFNSKSIFLKSRSQIHVSKNERNWKVQTTTETFHVTSSNLDISRIPCTRTVDHRNKPSTTNASTITHPKPTNQNPPFRVELYEKATQVEPTKAKKKNTILKIQVQIQHKIISSNSWSVSFSLLYYLQHYQHHPSAPRLAVIRFSAAADLRFYKKILSILAVTCMFRLF